MSYKKRTITAGKVKETTLYHTSKCQSPKRPRIENENTKKELNDKKNKKRACKRLYLLMNANFITGDLYLTLTYEIEPTPEEAKKSIERFFDRLRSRYKKLELPIKYIAMTEGKRIHHHILINNIGLGVKEFKKIWKLGFINMQIFMGEPEDCERLANYFMKKGTKGEEKIWSQNWSSSRSLIRPVPEIDEVAAGTWREDPKPIKGYYIDVIQRGHTEHNYPYLFYRMIKIPGSDEDH